MSYKPVPLVLSDLATTDKNYIIAIKVNYQDNLEYFYCNDIINCITIINDLLRNKYLDNYIIEANVYHKKHGRFIHSIIL